MIRNAVVHLNNEQPLLVDLFEVPKALDQGLLCTNVRTMDGKRPVFIDRTDGVFFFPYLHVRFVEFSSASSGLPEIESGPADTQAGSAEVAEDPDAELELDEDFLRRIREV
jgi:hypothetical protein